MKPYFKTQLSELYSRFHECQVDHDKNSIFGSAAKKTSGRSFATFP